MLKIRLFRVGKKNQPSFKIVVTDKRRPAAGGRFVEEVGFWNPLTKEKTLKGERIKYWLSVGAKPSNTVYNLLIQSKILEGKKTPVHKKKKEKPGTKTEEPKAVKTETKKVETKETKPEETKVEEVGKEEQKKEEQKKEVKTEEKPEEKKSAPAAPASGQESTAQKEEKSKKEQTPNNP
jgi:small subunit ribosomal protein S16